MCDHPVMAARLTLKAINAELALLGTTARLAKASGYFFFHFGKAVNWLDRTVNVPTLNALTLEQWIEEYRRLKKVNAEIMRQASAAGKAAIKRSGRGS